MFDKFIILTAMLFYFLAVTAANDKDFPSGWSYLIKNKNSNMYMSDVSYKSPSYSYVEQWPLLQDGNRDSQIWFVFPVNEDHYAIFNKRTGMVMGYFIKHHIYGPMIASQFPWREDVPKEWQSWQLLRDSDSTSYFFKNWTITNPEPYIVVGFYSTDAGMVYGYNKLEAVGPRRDAQLFSFEVVDKNKKVEDADKNIDRDVSDIGKIRKMTGWQPPHPPKTDEVLLGQMSIPFYLINDPDLTPTQQATQSPYYILRRFGYWQLVLFYDHSGASQITLTKNITVGLITNNAKKMESILGLSVDADGSLVLAKSRPPLTSWKIGKSLKINVNQGSSSVSSTSIQLERKFLSRIRQLEATWGRHDRFVLERLDGTAALEWVIRDPVISVGDVFRGDPPPEIFC